MYIELKDEEKTRISNIFIDPIFKKVIDEIMQEKRDDIVDKAEDIEQLTKLRYTLSGVADVYKQFEEIHLEYRAGIDPQEKVDPNAILPNVNL